MIEQIITSTVLIVLVLVVSTILQKSISPCMKYALWLLVACKLLVPMPEFQTNISVMNVVNQFEEKDMQGVDITQEKVLTENSKNVAMTATTGEVITIVEIGKRIWMLGVVVCFGVFLWNNVRFRLQLRKQRIFLRNYKDTLAVYKVKGIVSPCLCGSLKPAIYIPEENGLSEEQLEYALAHEYTHYKHGDSIWGVVRCVCVILYWYNPIVWIAAQKSIRDGEVACDAGTIKQIGEQNSINYGKMLIELAQKVSKQSLNLNVLGGSASVTGGTSEMKKRIQMIAKKPNTKGIAVLALVLASIGMVGFTYGSAEEENTKEISAIVETMQNAEKDWNELEAVKQMNTTKGELVEAEEQMQEEMNAIEVNREEEMNAIEVNNEEEMVMEQMNVLEESVETEELRQEDIAVENAVNEEVFEEEASSENIAIAP